MEWIICGPIHIFFAIYLFRRKGIDDNLFRALGDDHSRDPSLTSSHCLDIILGILDISSLVALVTSVIGDSVTTKYCGHQYREQICTFYEGEHGYFASSMGFHG